jgi:hypothetical protein
MAIGILNHAVSEGVGRSEMMMKVLKVLNFSRAGIN